MWSQKPTKTCSPTYQLQVMWSVHPLSSNGGELETNYKIQYLVYFVSVVLSDSKTRYFHIMKIAYELLITSHKLSHYFQVHHFEVPMSLTLGEILNNKWVIELFTYDIIYKLRTTIMAQALSDFVAEWTEFQTPPKERDLEYWTINFDWSLQLQGAGVGILVTYPKGGKFHVCLANAFSSI
jgi:hypothetical protein